MQVFFEFFLKSPISNTTPIRSITVKQIHNYIISNYAKEATEVLCGLMDTGVRRAFKARNFDYVTFSGTFTTRRLNGLIEHSGLMCFDIDKIPTEERLQKIKSQLVNDEMLHTVLLFRSPSGNGLKWVVELPDRHWQNTEYRVQIIKIFVKLRIIIERCMRGLEGICLSNMRL